MSPTLSAATTPPPPAGFRPGLEGHVAFRTRIAEPDRDGGALRYRGVDVEELAGRVTFGNVWALLVDVPRGMDRIACPVLLVQGTADWIAMGQTVRYLPLIPGSRFRRRRPCPRSRSAQGRAAQGIRSRPRR